MDSDARSGNSKFFFRKISRYEIKNSNVSDSQANSERIELGCFFFDLLKDISIDIRIKENSLRLFDKLKNMEEFNPLFKRIFLLGTLQISLKLYEPSHKEKISKAIECLENFNHQPDDEVPENTVIKSKTLLNITIDEINMAEMFILNNLDWKYNVVLISDTIFYFIESYLSQIFNFIENEPFMAYICLITESALAAFDTKLTCLSALTICIIIIAIDQFYELPCYQTQIKPIVKNFLTLCNCKYGIDFFYVENLKKIFLDFLNLINCKLVKVIPDDIIKDIKQSNEIEIKEVTEKMKCQTWFLNQRLTDILSQTRSKKSCKTSHFKKCFQEDSDKIYNRDGKKFHTICLYKSAIFEEDQQSL